MNGDEQINLPEAPVSVTVRGFYKGYSVLLTNRDPNVQLGPLLSKAIEAIDWMEENGWHPSWEEKPKAQAQPADEPREEHLCPIHNVPMIPHEGKFGTFWSHGRKDENGTWFNCTGTGWKEATKK